MLTEGSNAPPEPLSAVDHDTVVELRTEVKSLIVEVKGLRDWRHDNAVPVMIGLQAQTKALNDQVSKVTENVDKLVTATATLLALPVDFLRHEDSDQKAFIRVDAGIHSLHEKLSENSAERTEQHKKLIYWVAGIIITGLAAVVAAQWAFIQPHLPWH